VKLALSLVFGAALLSGSAQADLLWRWSCKGAGFDASGTLTTRDAPNEDGFYEIVGIAGEANGVSITTLQPAGTAIPQNAGYPIDNLVREAAPQLSIHGFAFLLANGSYANPFYGAHFSPPHFYAFLSDPATGKTNEPTVAFAAEVLGRRK
jgi:hypothetical protein